MGKKQKKPADEPAQQRPPDVDRVGNLARSALDPKQKVAPEVIEEQLQELSPEEALMFVKILEITLKRRRMQMLGYIFALVSVVFGMLFAVYLWGSREPGEFIGWVFIIPPAAAGLCLWLFGRWANRIRG